MSTPGSRFSRRHADGAQLAGLDLAFVFAEARNAGGDLAAEDRRQRLAAAGERNVVDLLGVGADRAGEQRRHHVVDAAGRAAGEGHLGDVGLDGCGEILRRLDRRIRRHHDDLDFLGEPRDRRHLVERHRRLVHGERADHDEAVDHQLVAVALGAVDELRDADAAAGAGDVGDLDAADDLGGDQRLLHRARGLIPAAAGRGRRHDLELELLREGRAAAASVSATTAPNRRV